ncbi:hypothetical protein BLOT_004391 [Blomia tropicalis]|nr:hypothetical protein BLOT_004391 [Blomia tropicalis]
MKGSKDPVLILVTATTATVWNHLNEKNLKSFKTSLYVWFSYLNSSSPYHCSLAFLSNGDGLLSFKVWLRPIRLKSNQKPNLLALLVVGIYLNWLVETLASETGRETRIESFKIEFRFACELETYYNWYNKKQLSKEPLEVDLYCSSIERFIPIDFGPMDV